MDTEYDRKFEEMKKYIPFLENMITRLESTSTSSSNPRQAQLDKIRSLRDLLSNKKKRMKMENLLKCEQVLVNLYVKVEQRDTLSGVKKNKDSGFLIDTPTPKEKSDLEAVRNKLKTVAKRQDVQDTLPEILPRSEINDVHTSGTKEPALFQRRPKQQSSQQSKEPEESRTSPQSSTSKRNYTRVLVSPERRWSPTTNSVEKPLFSRRSPRKSPRRYSPTYHKKERKKSKDSQKRKDLNITLNVPEESLNSLNTKDILSRIINCSDGDVDIDTLRELRKQILGELQKTGAKDDISDLILKSYKNKNKSKTKEEVEEGELSDSESEAIESIYGSLVVKDPGQTKVSADKDKQPRKIQICLVINSDDKIKPKPDISAEFAELEMYENENKESKKKSDAETEPNNSEASVEAKNESKTNLQNQKLSKDKSKDIPTTKQKDIVTVKSKENINFDTNEKVSTPPKALSADVRSVTEENVSSSPCNNETDSKESIQFKANFYKPLTEQTNSETADEKKDKDIAKIGSEDAKTSDQVKLSDIESTLQQMEKSPEIPLLHERTIERKPPESTLSEIDILQALKNEILSDITMPGTETSTPLLHQPKVMKVASAQEILPKKRISIEKYKEKSITSSKPNSEQISLKDDQIKKPSLKLTDKECERFFNIPKISFDDEEESLDEDDGDILASDVYGDLAPKSPDHDESSNLELAPPVIIPVDPVKAVAVNPKADVDMRTLPILSPSSTKPPTVFNTINTSTNNEVGLDKIKSENSFEQGNTQNRPTLVDPRVRRDLNPNVNSQSPNPHSGNSDGVTRPNIFTGIPSSSTTTPNQVITTNARTYEMTPTHQSFEIDQSSRKHVYVPTGNSFDYREKEKSVNNEARPRDNLDAAGDRRSHVDDVREACWNSNQRDNVPRNTRFNESTVSKNDRYHVDKREDIYHRSETPVTSTQSFTNQCQAAMAPHQSFGRSDCPATPGHPFGRLDCPPTPSHPFGRAECSSTPSHPFGRLECPPTPSHPFGRTDCPPTPSHPFGRTDCPPTPSHPFVRTDCPPTPSHPFGRTDCPPTPSHPFGRTDCPPTPSHPFGRTDCPPTPSHPFGRTDCPLTPSHPFGRMDCPPTPNHPFGRIDCPPTPNHPFGRAECPTTPSHPFARTEGPLPLMLNLIECPPTPIHPFGAIDCPVTPTPIFARNECPPNSNHTFAKSECTTKQNHQFGFHETTPTPNHPYGRTDPTKTPYARSDFNTQKYTKDPRLNRKPDPESKSPYDERDGGYYKDRDRYRSSSYSSQKSYSDRNYDREQTVGSRSKYKYYSPDLLNKRQHSRDQEKYDRSLDRSVSKDRERRQNSEIKSHEEVASRSSRTSNVCKQSSKETEQNALSVKNAGRSFNIDTSVNTTFVKHRQSTSEIDVSSSVFDARRQRAASVGRSLTRESSVGRTLSQVSQPKTKSNENKREAFRRAASVGRDIFDSATDERSFQEIKADFKSCRFSTKEFGNKRSETRNSYKSTETWEHSRRSRKDFYDKDGHGKRGYESSKSYSPRKNYRDPRMRRQLENRSDRRSYDSPSRQSGIIYSNDNIVTGSILKSGYGVKNYKIPKIKRAVEEKEDKNVERADMDSKKDGQEKDIKKNEHKEKETVLEKEKIKVEEKSQLKEPIKKEEKLQQTEVAVSVTEQNKELRNDVINSNEVVERRLTRSSKKNMLESKADFIAKPRKCKNVIHDSESDSEVNTTEKDSVNTTKKDSVNTSEKDSINNMEKDSNTDDKKISTLEKSHDHGSPVKQNKSKKLNPADLDSSFGIEELEMFADNITSDPVIDDNINALIADLDNDLSTSKTDTSHNFTKEITLENMMQNISNPNQVDDDTDKLLEAIDKISNDNIEVSMTENIKETQNKLQLNTSTSKNIASVVNSPKNILDLNINDENNSCLKDTISNTPTQSDAIHKSESEVDSDLPSDAGDKTIIADIDSTTEIEKTIKDAEDNKPTLDEQNTDGCSTPDSTINTELSQKLPDEESLPGSTNEVTSTECIEPKPSSSAKEGAPALDSIGSLLSILQDKSKIKELLNMLGGHSSENEKIKKKLEKLSEIVSDDEETCDVPSAKADQTEKNNIEQSGVLGNDNTDSKQSIYIKQIDTTKDNQNSKDSSILSENESKLEDDDTKNSDIDADMQETDTELQNKEVKLKKKPVKKAKAIKKPKGKPKKVTSIAMKRVTRANAVETKPKIKKPPRELQQLQEDIKEMFIRDEVLSATGIRMCRLAKLVDEKAQVPKDEPVLSDVGPVVVLEKFKDTTDKNTDTEKVKRKKIGSKTKAKFFNDNVPEDIKDNKMPISFKHKPGPKSKTKNKKDDDPYAFETDSVGGDTNTEKASDDGSSINSDSESDSLASCKSFGSTELLADIKKKTKRKRRGWQAGVIKTKPKKKKVESKLVNPGQAVVEDVHTENVLTPDLNCFTDRNYCFRKNQFIYSCRLCSFNGHDIVLHYRNQHPHVEIPLSRMTPEVAKEAIEQCEEINFKAISKIPSDKYVCTFCYKEFSNSKSVLETFFWHIVSMHTGEYKQICPKCPNISDCPYNLDIPPPPKDIKGQLIGFICKKCNFTQISLENLKTHVIIRHNDEQTAVYTINLSVMTKKSLNMLLRRSESEESPLQISSDNTEKDNEVEGVKTRTSARIRSNQLVTPPIQAKLTFEGDDNSDMSDMTSETSETNIKVERIDSENTDVTTNNEDVPASDINNIDKPTSQDEPSNNEEKECSEPQPCDDIVDYPHFKINVTESGAKEYFCCVNRKYHFKTTLLISMKKHVQSKHSETWDGYCYVCKVIVTPQGTHRFRDCLQHYLDKHMDDFPIYEEEVKPTKSNVEPVDGSEPSAANQQASKPYINVRPLSDLLNNVDATVPQESAALPIIQSVMSLGTATVEPPRLSPIYSPVLQTKVEEKTYKYEEHQAAVISKKYYLVIQAMMVPEMLVKIFKCAGRYCSYATDSAEEALAHATTHQRIGGADALNCCYCDFDSAGNAVDLVMHMFKSHGCCQYCCQQCFYRAASSQAVGAHILRVHGVSPVPGSVLRSSTLPSVPTAKHNMLTREQAVSYYTCGHSDGDGSCKFRNYTPEKLVEHLSQRHPSATAHPCPTCSIEVPTAADLVHHMKTHGLKLYQCTWCVHGADNEIELLDHVSIAHPDKPPQAYMRIITIKDAPIVEQRVLPLAVLNKHKVPTKDVTTTPAKEHPVREAERSVEMETLIAPFVNQSTPTETTEIPIQTAEYSNQIIDALKDTKPPKDILIPITSNTQDTVVTESPNPAVAPPATDVPDVQPKIVKTEPAEKNVSKITPVLNIVVLDSDDEDTPAPPQQPVIDLSEEEVSPNAKKDKASCRMVPTTHLYTCPRCKQVCKNMGGLKKHIYSCAVNATSIVCPHCGQPAENLEKLVWHYVADHSEKNTFECGLCGALLVTENFARKHVKTCHKDGIMVITPNEKDGAARFTINVRKKSLDLPREKVAPKRKLSGPKVDPTPTKRRFEPQEIDQLPINPILDHLVYCSRCEFSTKVRLNMVRHLQLHAEQQPVPQTAPVNPVPHLESNEKHFDKMVNLASSSIVNRTPDKVRSEQTPSVTLLIPPEAATRYPKYVPERQRHTCGAKGCSYISVDEAMLRCHWDTLHAGASDFHCVHCPPHQHLDTSKPLTASRIISHLKMHDATLYACSTCYYYHYRKEAIDKHLNEVHKTSHMIVVRDEYSATVSPNPVQMPAAPTMDLKPWQCGLCKFKSMLRPEVVEHCSKFHQSKMQFKCAYCPFRTSAVENISKHQTNSHAGKPEEIFYYYYREGSIPDEADGTPRWVKQRQKSSNTDTNVKLELSMSPVPNVTPAPNVTSVPVSSPVKVNLSLVKKEVDEPSTSVEQAEQTIEGLCKLFGQICDPNGIKFKCPLCSVMMDDTREGMQSHLYEELNYRKWSCGLCSYKAFHKKGLTDHMTSEHRRQYDHIELPTDHNIEKWVTSVLNHQAEIITKYKENLAKQKIIVENKPGPSTETVVPKETVVKYNEKDLETAFGPLGSHNNYMFCCPKCGFLSVEEVPMRDHLEMELNKIRWCCSNCPENFQTYHEAQFHCKGHDGPSRPVEAIRNPTMRAAWVSTAIQKQKTDIQNVATPAHSAPPTPEKTIPDNDNSLLVVRYEERVPTPDQVTVRRKRPAPTIPATPTPVTLQTPETDAERPIFEEPGAKKKPDNPCPYCDYKSPFKNNVKIHMLTHFNLKPYTCGYCKFSSHKKGINKHIQQMHPDKPMKVKMTEIPPDARKSADARRVICLVCERAVPDEELDTHLHGNVKPQFAKVDIVIKCCVCLTLCLDAEALKVHHSATHPDEAINYSLYRLCYDSRETYQCAYCNNRFKYIKDYKAHHTAVHAEMPFNLASSAFSPPAVDTADKISDGSTVVVQKRCARKSTTKLPSAVAKKSTTKLPLSVATSLDDEEYSYYGTRASPLAQYSHVTTLMSFCNKMMPFTVKQLSDLLNIDPKVVLTDMKHSSD